ncbi:disease resistance protein At4g27190-like [Tasmannia lanceolata]|uniref:disease resistance protein At4g27190-like n=1 Tax=Tasmannia lanceolata TaxID=3420 RepID=UPI00406333AD
MYGKVFLPLKLSFDRLERDETKLCFLFCCLFQEDADIDVQLLTRYGMGEGMFRNVETLEEASDRMHILIDELKSCCLLLHSDKEGCVKMHDVTRDVGKWISSDHDNQYEFLIRAGEEVREWPTVEEMKVCKRLSLMENLITTLPDQPECPNIMTLLLQRNYRMRIIPNNFFVPELTIFIEIITYPLSKWVKLLLKRSERIDLVEGCQEGVTDILHLLDVEGGGFDSLKFLLLYNFSKMEHFIHFVEKPHRVPPNAFGRLQVMYFSGMDKLEKIFQGQLPHGFLGNLREIIIRECRKLKNILPYHHLLGLQSLEELSVEECEEVEEVFHYEEGIIEEGHAATTSPLSELYFRNLPKLTSIWKGDIPPPGTLYNLRKLTLNYCRSLRCLFSPALAQNLQQLEYLEVRWCDEIEEILSVEEDNKYAMLPRLLPRLQYIHLSCLPKLRSLCYRHNRGGESHVLFDFPCLQTIIVSYCSNLKRLPVGPQSAPKLEEIRGENIWFEELEWEDESVMSRLRPLFHPIQGHEFF